MVELGLGWNQETVVRLIEEYRKRSELWDTSHPSYRVPSLKYEAWSDLAAMFECEVADLRRKMNSILASLRREKQKVRCGGRSTWFLYDHLYFMPRYLTNNEVDNIVPKKSPNREEIEELEQSDNDQEDDHDSENILNHGEEDEDNEVVDEAEEEQELIFIKQEPITGRYIKTSSKFQSRQPVNKPRLVRRFKKKPNISSNNTNRLDSKLLETLRLIRRSDFVKKKDECDSFGEYIADSLRKHDERTQSMIKQAINNILFEQEMKKYGPGPYEVLISTDENPLILEETSK